MINITEDNIRDINTKAPYDFCVNEQGIFKQPYGIPTDVKDYVIYMRNKTSWCSGGNCHGGVARYFENDTEHEFIVLDILLEMIYPKISFIQYKKITSLIHTNNETDREYYGNSTDYKITYIVLSELLTLLNTF